MSDSLENSYLPLVVSLSNHESTLRQAQGERVSFILWCRAASPMSDCLEIVILRERQATEESLFVALLPQWKEILRSPQNDV